MPFFAPRKIPMEVPPDGCDLVDARPTLRFIPAEHGPFNLVDAADGEGAQPAAAPGAAFYARAATSHVSLSRQGESKPECAHTQTNSAS